MGYQKWLCLCAHIFLTYFWRSRWCVTRLTTLKPEDDFDDYGQIWKDSSNMSRLHIKDHSSSDFRPRAWGQISVTFMYYRSINLRSSKKVKGWIISRSNKLLSSSLLNTIFNLLKVNVAEFYFNGVYHTMLWTLF